VIPEIVSPADIEPPAVNVIVATHPTLAAARRDAYDRRHRPAEEDDYTAVTLKDGRFVVVMNLDLRS